MEMSNVTFVDGYSTPQNAQAGNKVLGKDDFLRLLVTKLSYQDPLNPIDDEDFVAQLAQFSSLEQMENMNKNLENDLQWNYLLSQTISNTMSTSLIGRKVTAETTILHLDTGGSSDIRLNLKEPAARLEVTIYDTNGTAIRSITQDNPGKGDIVVHWDGLDDQGVQAVAGDYQVQVTAVDLSGEEFKPGMYVEGKVDRVVYNDGIAYLSVNGQSVPLAAVREVEEG